MMHRKVHPANLRKIARMLRVIIYQMTSNH
jgi:hypothetical protein